MNITSLTTLSALALAAATVAQNPQDPDAGPRTPSTVDLQAQGFGDGLNTVHAQAHRNAPTADLGRHVGEIHTQQADPAGGEYGIWAAAGDYKVSFHNGMTFVPYLGSGYPHNQPFSWTTRSVKIGQKELVTSQPQPIQGKHRFQYDLGGVVETYDVLAEGLEQTFVIDERPGAGDLVVKGAVDSLLTAKAATAAHQSIDFVDADGHHILTYGAATAIDAEGRAFPMTTGYANGLITLSLAAQQVEEAAFPLVVDPLLTAITLRTWGTATNGEPGIGDVYREDESTTDNVWFAYARFASATDRDLRIWRVDDAFAGVDLAAYDDITTTWDTWQPAIACAPGADTVCTAFTRDFGGSSGRFIRVHGHLRTDLTQTTAVGFLGNATNTWRHRPDLGGYEAFGVEQTIVMVLQQEDQPASPTTFVNSATSEIYSIVMDFSGGVTPSFGAATLLEGNSSTLDFERPRLSSVADSDSDPFAMAYNVFNNTITGDDWDAAVEMVDSTGAVASTQQFIDSASLDHKLAPIVDGQEGRFLVFFSKGPIASFVPAKPAGRIGFALATARFDFNGTSGSFEPTVDMAGINTTSLRWTPGGIGYDTNTRSHWVATFHSTSGSAYAQQFGYDAVQLLPSLQNTGGAGTRLSGGVSFDNDNQRFMMVFGSDDGGPAMPIYGNEWEYAAVTAATQSGTSCSPVNLSWSGAGFLTNQRQAIGSEFVTLSANGASATSVHFMLVALATRDTLIIGPQVGRGCRLLVQNGGPDFVQILDFRVGANVSWDLQLPSFLAADTFYFQDWHTNAAGNLFFSSQRLEVEVGK